MHFSYKKAFISLLVISIFLQITSCSKPKQDYNFTAVAFTAPVRTPGEADEKTKEMIELVAQAISRIDIKTAPYVLNNLKAASMAHELEGLTGNKRVNHLFKYGIELLNAGKTEESIETLKEVLAAIEAINVKGKADKVFTVKKQLAIAYMRKGEQDNCLVNHTNESCIIPFSANAQHILKEGSEKAIKLLNELLAHNPNDYECQYLLNIAHMTLGQYPHHVPEQFRIPETYFSSPVDFPRFSDIGTTLGVDVSLKAGGTCVDDFNGDGYLDIIASSWGYDDQIRYFENDRAGGFVDKTDEAGLKGVFGGKNLRHADYNNDGHMDFIILRGGWLHNSGAIPNSLMRNNGDGTFTDVSIESGTFSPNPTQTAVWIDVNLDGWIDLFIANEWSPAKQSKIELFLNQADGTFKNIATEAGITATGYFKGVSTGDLNNDMYPDLYLSNYNGTNTLYINTTAETGNPSFKVATKEAGVANPIHSFPTWIFDYNNDGLEDIFVSGYSSSVVPAPEMIIKNVKHNSVDYRPLLYKNNGDGTFTEVSLQVNLDEPIATMGCNFGDLDNDGYLDFYLATGDPSYFSIVPNRMFRNVNGETFQDVTYSGGFGHIQKGHAIGFGDFDLDGDQDIYAVMGGAFEGDVFGNLLFENPIGNKNNWINIVLEGKRSNRAAMGAKIVLTIEENGKERNIYHSVGTDASFGGNSIMAEIGIGKASTIKKIEIKWPHFTKEITSFENIKANQTIKITEGSSSIETLKLPKTTFKNKSKDKDMDMHHHHNH